MNSMKDAPRNRERVLLKYWPRRYSRMLREWTNTPEPKWEECFWRGDIADLFGSKPHWEPWEGSTRSRTTEHILEEHCLGWMPIPDDKTIYFDQVDFERYPEPHAQTLPKERSLAAQLTGALRFIMAFYEPNQRHLDTEAWKVAHAAGIRALRRGEWYLLNEGGEPGSNVGKQELEP